MLVTLNTCFEIICFNNNDFKILILLNFKKKNKTEFQSF